MTVKSFLNILSKEEDALPIYQKIKEHILERIAKGEWRANQKLPSENEISAILNVSRMTVNRAFKELTEEGYLFREKGAGTFVSEPFQLIPFFELMPISQELAVEGNIFSSKIFQMEEIVEDLKIENLFVGQLLKKPCFYSDILYYSNDIPIQFEKRYVSQAFAPQYLAQTFQIDCSTSYLQKLSPILSQKHTLDAMIPDAKLRQILEIEAGEACFKVSETLAVNQKIISFCEQFYPASRYQFHSKI